MAPKIDSNYYDENPIQVVNEKKILPDAATFPHDENVEGVKVIDCLKKNQVCIDGDIFDLDAFKHPGGDSINIFGGNDVTIFYKMIHPRHSQGHHKKSMIKVGDISGYKCDYKFTSDFERELKAEVFKMVRPGKEFGTPGYLFRVAIYVSFFFACLGTWIFSGSSYWLAFVYGMSAASIGLNVQHDANHGAASRIGWVNDVLGLGANFIGGDKWIWMEKHWTHHAYTNHKDCDPDCLSGEPIAIFNNYPVGHPNRKWYHAFQAFYIIPVLSLYWLSTIVSLEVWDLQDGNATTVGMNFKNDFVSSRAPWAVLSRVLNIYIHIILPFQQHGFTLHALGHIVMFAGAGSLGLGLLFFLSHNFEGADRDPTEITRLTGEPVCWYRAQVETSSTYGGFISGALTGGLNFQVEHHLFPRMCSAWYPFIAPKVREICKKHGVNYTYYPWIWQNMISTLRFINSVGNDSVPSLVLPSKVKNE